MKTSKTKRNKHRDQVDRISSLWCQGWRRRSDTMLALQGRGRRGWGKKRCFQCDHETKASTTAKVVCFQQHSINAYASVHESGLSAPMGARGIHQMGEVCLEQNWHKTGNKYASSVQRPRRIVINSFFFCQRHALSTSFGNHGDGADPLTKTKTTRTWQHK